MKNIYGLAAFLFLLVACQGSPDLAAMLADETKLMNDSGFIIEFPGDRSRLRKISVTAKAKHVDALFHDSQGKAQTTNIEAPDYQGLVAELRDIKESELSATNSETCFERFELTVRVGRKSRHFEGCRGVGPGASAVSRVARQLEFLMVKRTSS